MYTIDDIKAIVKLQYKNFGGDFREDLLEHTILKYDESKAEDLPISGVSKCTCLQDCDNCGAKQVQFICSGSEVCPECFC